MKKSQEFFIPGRFPGANDYIKAERSNRYAGASMKKEYTGVVKKYCEWMQIEPHHLPVHVSITYFEPNARRDPDNIVFAKKFILDGLVGAGVIPNDTQEYVLSFEEHWQVAPEDEVGVTIKLQEEIHHVEGSGVYIPHTTRKKGKRVHVSGRARQPARKNQQAS